MRKTKALYALGSLVLLGASLMLFILASVEQSILSSGSPTPERIRLQDFIARGPAKNKHIELSDFYIGKQYIYTAKLVQFVDVYLPLFPKGQPEEANNLHLLLWVRNDRNSNERLIQDVRDLDQLVAEINSSSHPAIGVLRDPMDRVRTLTVEAYPGTNRQALQVLWARNFPSQDSVNVFWAIFVVCLAGAVACAVGYRRSRKLVPAGNKSRSDRV